MMDEADSGWRSTDTMRSEDIGARRESVSRSKGGWRAWDVVGW